MRASQGWIDGARPISLGSCLEQHPCAGWHRPQARSSTRNSYSRCQTARRIANGESELWLRFHKPTAQGVGFVFTSLPLNVVGFVFTKRRFYSPFATRTLHRSRDASAPGVCNFPLATPRGGEAPRDTRYPGVLGI